MDNVREYKIAESEMAYLSNEEIRALLKECEASTSKDLLSVVKLCLATGARWGEAETLKGNQIRAGKVIFTKTKGKKIGQFPSVMIYFGSYLPAGMQNLCLGHAMPLSVPH